MTKLTHANLLRVWTFLFCIFSYGPSMAQKPDPKTPLEWGIWMAKSDIQRNPDAAFLDFSSRPKWSYTQGLVCLADQRLAQISGMPEFYEYGLDYAEKMIDDKGVIETYKQEKYNLDLINSGKILFEIYRRTSEEKFHTAIGTLYSQLKSQPRTKEGGFWHKKIYTNQMWLDGTYMADPFYAQYIKVFGNPEDFKDVVKQITIIQKHTYDPVTGLNYHGWDESKQQKWADPKTGCSPNFWGRAEGWYIMAIVDILDFVPQKSAQHNELVKILNIVSKAVVQVQDSATGLWYQVLDQGNRKGNYLEATASCMFVYALAKAVRKGYIDDSYSGYVKKGFHGILDNLIQRNSDGSISLTHCCAVAGLGGNPYRDGSFEYYVNTTVRSDDPKGVGPFIMACIELQKISH